jgi:hypothetical protein
MNYTTAAQRYEEGDDSCCEFMVVCENPSVGNFFLTRYKEVPICERCAALLLTLDPDVQIDMF